MPRGKLYLIPTPIGEGLIEEVIPQATLSVVQQLHVFVVEELRTARRFLSRAKITTPINALTFFELNEHTAPEQIYPFLQPALDGHSIGLLSEAGAPAVADPGAALVQLAHGLRIDVVPMVGPSSILLALMASGLNGQSFAFAGYLPIPSHERRERLKQLEHTAITSRQTQLFIETPYRNLALFADILLTAAPSTRLCVAAGLTRPEQFIRTATIAQWKAAPVPDIHKKPCLFLLGY
ncbi:MAG: SAM-dependent methyltransferase [Prevotellaceae bacterium]|jgi:16S rRNA (cytidine1402-2'-O)-methyltransferase|nr:SAM-dependent methyltransferase [Prevotellaceae bacterium]